MPESAMGVETMEKLPQLSASKLPREGARLAVRELLVEKEALFDFRETRAVVRREPLTVHDGEVNCHLIEPTGMNRRVHHKQIGVRLCQTTHGGFASGRGAVIDEPEDALGSAVGLLFHHWRHQATKGLNTGRRLTPPHDAPPADIPGGQVWQGPAPLVFVLNPHCAPGRGRQTRMAAEARLDPRLFIGTETVLPGAQWRPLPVARIQIPHAARLLGKGGIAGKDPILVAPGFDGIGRQNPPDRARPDRLAQRLPRLRGEVGRRAPTQRQAPVMDRFTGYSFDQGLLQRGKTRSCVRAPAHQPSQTPPEPSVASNTARC